MSERIPPCFDGECTMLGQDWEGNRQLCFNIAQLIIEAGGDFLFEETLCPMEVLKILGPEQSDPLKARIRERVGVVGYLEWTDE